MFSIGDISKRTGVKVPTIRYYEQLGLITPPQRSAGNQRRYSAMDLKRLAFIKHAREQKYNGRNPPRLVLFSPIAAERHREAIESRETTAGRARAEKGGDR